MRPSEYLELLLKELGREFAPVQRFTAFTKNPALIGAHAEAAVRAYVRRMAAPLRVSTGSIIHEGNVGPKGNAPQLDTMLWWLATAPPVFESGDFALVPRGSCFGVLEIKSSTYSEAGSKMKAALDKCEEQDLFHGIQPVCLEGDFKSKRQITPKALGIFCVQRKGTPGHIAKQLIESERAIVLIKEDCDGTYQPNPDAIRIFINMLLDTRLLAFNLHHQSRLPKF